MKPFQFRLASVVRIREMQLRAEEFKLAELTVQRSRLESSLTELQRSLDQSWSTQKARPAFSSSELIALQALEDHHKRQAVMIRQQLAAQEELICKQRAVLIEIRRNLRLFEKLKEERLTEWQADADREMGGLVDDLANARSMRLGQVAGEKNGPGDAQNVTPLQRLQTILND